MEDILYNCGVGAMPLRACIPPFWRDHRELWFIQFEAVVAPVKLNEEEKFDLVVAIIGKYEIQQISEIIQRPPSNDRYDALKKRLLSTNKESEAIQLHKILEKTEVGDVKPTQEGTVSSVNAELSMDKLELIADKIMKHTEEPTVYATTSSPNTPSTPVTTAHTDEKLTLEMPALRAHNDRSNDCCSFEGHRRSRSRFTDRRTNRKQEKTPTTACRSAEEITNHFRETDLNTRELCLVDTEAEVAILAVKNKSQVRASNAYSLFATNNSPSKSHNEEQKKRHSVLKFAEITLPRTSHTIETSRITPRFYVPATYHQIAYKAQHYSCHRRIGATKKIVSSIYFWPSVHKDTSECDKCYIGGQQAKFTWHVVTPVGESYRVRHHWTAY